MHILGWLKSGVQYACTVFGRSLALASQAFDECIHWWLELSFGVAEVLWEGGVCIFGGSFGWKVDCVDDRCCRCNDENIEEYKVEDGVEFCHLSNSCLALLRVGEVLELQCLA